MSWFNPSWQPSPHSHLLTPPHPEGWGGESERSVKLMGWDKNNLIGKAKAVHASKAKERIHSPLPMGRQVFGHPQENRAPSCVTVTREDKHHNAGCPPLLSSSPCLYTQHNVIWYGIPLWLVCVTCPGCVRSQFPVPLQPSCWQGPRNWKVLDLV